MNTDYSPIQCNDTILHHILIVIHIKSYYMVFFKVFYFDKFPNRFYIPFSALYSYQMQHV